MELAGEFTSRGSPTTIASVVARESATLSRFLSRRKLSPRGPAAPKLKHIEMMTTAARWQWNLSTDPMRDLMEVPPAIFSPACCRAPRTECRLTGERDRPGRSVRRLAEQVVRHI